MRQVSALAKLVPAKANAAQHQQLRKRRVVGDNTSNGGIAARHQQRQRKHPIKITLAIRLYPEASHQNGRFDTDGMVFMYLLL